MPIQKKLKQKKIRPLGDILLELEIILDEMIDFHGLQFGDLLYLVLGQLKIHRPDAQEQYIDGDHPEFYYGPKKK